MNHLPVPLFHASRPYAMPEYAAQEVIMGRVYDVGDIANRYEGMYLVGVNPKRRPLARTDVCDAALK